MIYFLIPAYNEKENIERLIELTSNYMDSIDRNFKFIFVNDGSSDGTLELLEQKQASDTRIVICSHYPNKGVKETFIEGFEKFLEIASEEDILITKEADNTSDNAITEKMIDALEKDGFDVALASCYSKGGGFENTSLLRLILSTGANSLIKVRFNLWGFHTFSSFYRAFTYNCLKKAFNQPQLPMTSDGFTCVVEMMIKLKKQGCKMVEIPMVLRSSERAGKSKMPILKTIKGYIKLAFSGLR